MPFLAPVYSPDNVQVARAIIADPGWLIPSSVYLVAEVWNSDADATHHMTPLTGLEGAFSRGRLLSGMVLEDILECARVGSIFKKLEPPWAQEEVDRAAETAGEASRADPTFAERALDAATLLLDHQHHRGQIPDCTAAL